MNYELGNTINVAKIFENAWELEDSASTSNSLEKIVVTDRGDHTAPHVGRDVTEDVTDTDLFWIVVNIFEETLPGHCSCDQLEIIGNIIHLMNHIKGLYN